MYTYVTINMACVAAFNKLPPGKQEQPLSLYTVLAGVPGVARVNKVKKLCNLVPHRHSICPPKHFISICEIPPPLAPRSPPPLCQLPRLPLPFAPPHLPLPFPPSPYPLPISSPHLPLPVAPLSISPTPLPLSPSSPSWSPTPVLPLPVCPSLLPPPCLPLLIALLPLPIAPSQSPLPRCSSPCLPPTNLLHVHPPHLPTSFPAPSPCILIIICT